MKNRKRILSKVWTGSIIAALLVSIGIFAAMLQIERSVLGEYERENIFVAARNIPKGQIITEENYQDYLKLQELDKNCVPKTALGSPEQIVGLVAASGIEAGVFLTTGMFEEWDEITADMQQPVIAGLKAEDLYQVVGGVLRAGDRIHIYMVSETGEAEPVWKNVFVEEVFDSSGQTIRNSDRESAAQRVNVCLDISDVARFYTELARGSLRVVKVCE